MVLRGNCWAARSRSARSTFQLTTTTASHAASWFARDKAGFAEPALPASLLGVITLAIIPVQILLIAFAMRGFQQGWNIELERLDSNADHHALPHST